MGAPVFTEAELRRAMKVANEFGVSVEICPRQGVIRLVSGDRAPVASPETGGESCDDIFGAQSG